MNEKTNYELPQDMVDTIAKMVHPNASLEDALVLIGRARFMMNRIQIGYLSVEAMAVLLTAAGFDSRTPRLPVHEDIISAPVIEEKKPVELIEDPDKKILEVVL